MAFLTTPQDPGDPSASGVHAVGLSEEHFTPAVQPLVLSPRSVTINTVRPVHATLPPDVPLVESDATPIPFKTKIHAEGASVDIPMTPTSDDWIVADLTSESAMVRPPIVHCVVINFSFQQDQCSPKTIDPVDEDCTQSPPFVSA